MQVLACAFFWLQSVYKLSSGCLKESAHALSSFVFADETDDQHRIVTTVFELAGEDQSGLLADVTHLLTTNGCDVRSAAVSVPKCTQLC